MKTIKKDVLLKSVLIIGMITSFNVYAYDDAMESETADEDYSRLNIEENVEYHNGFPFPKTNKNLVNEKAVGAKSASWYCEPYETKKFTNQASISISTKKPRSATSIYSAPSYWSIESAERKVTRTRGEHAGSSKLIQPNQDTLTVSQYQEIYQDVRSYLLDFDLPADITGNIDLKLQDFTSSYIYMAEHLKSTHGAVEHRGQAGKRGIFRKTHIYEAHMDVNVICVPAEATSATAAEATLKAWVNELVGV